MSVGGWLERPSPVGWNRELPLWALAGLQVVAAANRRASLLTIDLELIEELGAHWLRAARSQVGSAVILVAFQPPLRAGNLNPYLDRVGNAGETAVVVGDASRLLAWAPLAGPGSMPAELRNIYRRALHPPATKAIPGAPDDEEEGEDQA